MEISLLQLAPPTWTRTTLGEIVARGGGSIQTGPFGSQLHASDYVPEGVPSIMPVNIGDNRLIRNGIACIRESDAQRLSKHIVRTGDIIYSRRGDVKRRAIVRETEDGWFCGTGCLKVRLGHGVVVPEFAAFYLGHPEVRSWIVRHAVGITMPNLNTSIMESVPFLLPPLDEQQAIAETLQSLDDKIEQNRRTGAKLEDLARAVFKAWFVDFEPVKAKAAGATAFPGMPSETFAALPTQFVDSELGQVPEGWEVKALGSLGTVGRGSSPRPINNFMGGSVPWLKIADATASTGPFIYKTKEFVTESGATKSVAVAPGDLILSNSASCGIPMFVGLHGCIHDGWLHFRNLTQISKGWLYHFMKWKSEHLIHIADGSVQKNLNTRLINDLQLVVPPTQIHKAFAEMNDAVFLKIDAIGRESGKLAALRDYLLPRLLSGRVRVAGSDNLTYDGESSELNEFKEQAFPS